MTRTEVHKFGGTSVLNADRIRNAAAILDKASNSARICAVSSALGGVTNAIIAACATARSGDREGADRAALELRDRHLEALNDIRKGAPQGAEEVERDVEALFAEFRELLHGTALLHELTPRTADRIVVTGEKVAVRLLALALRGLGRDAVHLDADTFLETDAEFGQADPLSYTDCPGVSAMVVPLLDAGKLPVVTGFCGRAPDGATTTFGRGGSDFTATLIAAAIRADQAVIWTDVAGVYSADPRVVPDAHAIEHLNFREAAEMSYYGAKVLHPRTMIPISGLRIPSRIVSSLEPDLPGTLVDARVTAGAQPVKSVSAVKKQSIISVEGKGMVGVPGVAGRVFITLAGASLSVTMISQSSSEASVCFALPENEAEHAAELLRAEFRNDIAEKLIEDIAVRPDVSLIAAVGIGMAKAPGVAARVFGALAQQRVNVLAIAQGSSELNITLAVETAHTDTAVRAVHDAFHA